MTEQEHFEKNLPHRTSMPPKTPPLYITMAAIKQLTVKIGLTKNTAVTLFGDSACPARIRLRNEKRDRFLRPVVLATWGIKE